MNNVQVLSIKQFWSLNPASQVIKLFGKCCKNYIFETELETADYRFDLSLCIRKEEIDSLLQYWKQNDFVSTFESNPVWKNLYSFCQLWGDRDSILSKHIADLWFEFDELEFKTLCPRPCFFFSPIGLNGSISLGKNRDLSWLYDIALLMLYGESFNGIIKENIQRCIEALPGNGAIFQIGAMLPRKLKNVRLCTVMPVNHYPLYLRQIGWRGSFEYLITLLESLSCLADGIFVDIDIGDEISTKTGIECVYKKRTAHESGYNILERLLNYLIDLNLCIKEKADRVMEWSHEPLEEDEDGNYIKRSLSHIKVVLHPDNSIEAKSYSALSIDIKHA